MSVATSGPLRTAGSVVDLIGNTPLIRLTNFEAGLRNVELYAKAEWRNPGGSVKDRPAARMIADGERSGALTHDMMESEDFRVRVYEDSAVVTGLTRTKGKFMGQEFSTQERATGVFVKRDGRWQCVLTHLTRLPKK